jgi:hypothetical protein
MNRDFVPDRKEIILFAKGPKRALEPTHFFIVIIPGVKRPGLDDNGTI